MKPAKVLAILFFSTLIFAQTQATSASRDEILRLFEVMQIREQMRLVMDAVSQQMKAAMHDTVKKRGQITDEQLARLDKFSDETMKAYPVDALLDDMVPVYQKYLDKTDVDSMIAFYSTPTGQKLLRQMPAMTQDAMQVSYERMQKQMDSVMQRVDQMMKEEQQKPNPRSNPPPKPNEKN